MKWQTRLCRSACSPSGRRQPTATYQRAEGSLTRASDFQPAVVGSCQTASTTVSIGKAFGKQSGLWRHLVICPPRVSFPFGAKRLAEPRSIGHSRALAQRQMNENVQLVAIAGHPAEELLEQFVMKTTSETQTHAVDEHLQSCSGCRGRLGGVEDWVALMKSALPACLWNAFAPKRRNNLRVMEARFPRPQGR